MNGFHKIVATNSMRIHNISSKNYKKKLQSNSFHTNYRIYQKMPRVIWSGGFTTAPIVFAVDVMRTRPGH